MMKTQNKTYSIMHIHIQLHNTCACSLHSRRYVWLDDEKYRILSFSLNIFLLGFPTSSFCYTQARPISLTLHTTLLDLLQMFAYYFDNRKTNKKCDSFVGDCFAVENLTCGPVLYKNAPQKVLKKCSR